MITRSDGFVDVLAELGLEPVVEAHLVCYSLEAVEGRYLGETVTTGVALGELVRWPLVPPHWIHLPTTVGFRHTNAQQSPKPGWAMHSRQIARWGQDPNPAVGWISHVRSVIGTAIS